MTNHIIHRGLLLAILVSAAAPACVDSPSTTGDDTGVVPPTSGPTSGGGSDTFDHENNQISPWDLLARLEEEGPPTFTSHMHGCSKVHYATLGNVLASVGVDTTNTTQLSAGELYKDGFNALGGANYANRIRENVGITTSGASREFDIFAAAADEVIANIGSLTRCQVGGQAAVLFDATNACQASGLTCLLGVPATPTHLDLCNYTVQHASTPEVGKRLAVASLLAAAYTCE